MINPHATGSEQGLVSHPLKIITIKSLVHIYLSQHIQCHVITVYSLFLMVGSKYVFAFLVFKFSNVSWILFYFSYIEVIDKCSLSYTIDESVN